MKPGQLINRRNYIPKEGDLLRYSSPKYNYLVYRSGTVWVTTRANRDGTPILGTNSLDNYPLDKLLEPNSLYDNATVTYLRNITQPKEDQ